MIITKTNFLLVMWTRTVLFLSWSDNIHQHPNDRSNGNGLSLPLTSSPPHIGSLLSVRVEDFVPGSVCKVEAVCPQQEHENDDDDVFCGQHWLLHPQLIMEDIYFNDYNVEFSPCWCRGEGPPPLPGSRSLVLPQILFIWRTESYSESFQKSKKNIQTVIGFIFYPQRLFD